MCGKTELQEQLIFVKKEKNTLKSMNCLPLICIFHDLLEGFMYLHGRVNERFSWGGF